MSAGYSGTPLVRKLGIRPGHRVALLHAPDGFDEETLGELPADVALRARARGPLDVIVAFVRSRAELDRGLERWRAALDPAGGLWIAWPKRSSGVETDVSEGQVRAAGLALGLVDNKGVRRRRHLVGPALRRPPRRPAGVRTTPES